MIVYGKRKRLLNVQHGRLFPTFTANLAKRDQRDLWELLKPEDKMASVRTYLKPFRPILIMIFLLLVGFLTYVTAMDEPDEGVNDFAEFETEGDEEEEEETETHGTSDQDEDDEEGLIKS